MGATVSGSASSVISLSDGKVARTAEQVMAEPGQTVAVGGARLAGPVPDPDDAVG
ncbi:MAG TPA: hypothetical protein VE673_01315 [Pseudonocardiaceae bacterium]|nr:hypothetical protein [Pseudonocardiaceae bacterium]